jgi:hypothetical protein
MRRLLIVSLALLPLMVQAAPKRGVNLLSNGGFETVNGVAGAGWEQYGAKTAQFTSGAAGNGSKSLFCESTTGDKALGVMQEITFDPPLQHPFRVSGWSKADNVVGGEYCLYLDCFYDRA